MTEMEMLVSESVLPYLTPLRERVEELEKQVQQLRTEAVAKTPVLSVAPYPPWDGTTVVDLGCGLKPAVTVTVTEGCEEYVEYGGSD